MSNKATVLALDAKLFMADIVPLLEAEGLGVVCVAPKSMGVAQFEALCDAHSPAFVISVNFTPELAFLCSRRELTYVSWTVDPLPPARWGLHRGTDPRHCVAFLHRRSDVARAQASGLESHHLPLAASPRRTPAAVPSRPEQQIPVSFVGNSLADEERSFWTALVEAGATEAVVGQARAWLRSPASALSVSDASSWRDAVTLDDEQLVDLAEGARSHRLRMDRVRACLPLGVAVWGDRGWAELEHAFQGPADHGDQLTEIYRCSIVNLDIPRTYQRDIVTMRVFDVLAAGSVVVCETSSELARHFDVGQHIMTYADTSELAEVVRTLLVDAPLREQLRSKGHRHVMDHHRVEHRVKSILARLRSRIPSLS